MNVFVENEDRVLTALWAFPPEVVERLKIMLHGVAARIAARERDALSGHSKSGRQASSVRVKVSAFRDVSVTATVTVGGKRTAPHAHLFEEGFVGTETIRAHTRKKSSARRANGARVFGSFDVRSYERSVRYRKHGYLNAAKEAERAATLEAVAYAVGSAAADLELK